MIIVDLLLFIGIFFLLLAFGELLLMAALDLWVYWRNRR